MNNTIVKVCLVLALVLLIGAVWYFDLVSLLTVENLQHYQAQLGWWFPLIFVAAFVGGELIQVPSVLWIFLAGLIWPWWFAFVISLTAAVLAATVSFLVARFVLGDRIPERLPKRIADLDEKIQKTPIRAVILIRLTTFLHPALHWVLAASSLKVPEFLIGTIIGLAPFTLALVLLGETFMTWWDDYSVFIIGGGVAALCIYLYRNQTRKTEAPEEKDEKD